MMVEIHIYIYILVRLNKVSLSIFAVSLLVLRLTELQINVV